MPDQERNRLTRRLTRYARVSANVGGVAARMAGARLFGRDLSDAKNAADLAGMLGGLKGPLMKIAQMIATVPDLLPPEFASELQKLQSAAPPMGPAFVVRRMRAELGPDWESRFRSFDRQPAAAASLGQVHKAVGPDGARLACKLQYPDMQSAVEADLGQLGMILAVQRRFSPEIDTSRNPQGDDGAAARGARLRTRGPPRRALSRRCSPTSPRPRADVARELSTRRLLTMELARRQAAPRSSRSQPRGAQPHRHRACSAPGGIPSPSSASSTAIRISATTRSSTRRRRRAARASPAPAGINLLDFGCIRIFPHEFVQGVVDLYEGLGTTSATASFTPIAGWGFRSLTNEIIDTLNIWARFIYAPLLDDRVRTIADGVAPHAYGRREVWQVKQALRPLGSITIPREFVLMDRAAIGLGSVMLHLRAELNFHRLFAATIEDFSEPALAKRQSAALKAAGLRAE